MNFIVLLVFLGLNGAAALREHAVKADDRAQGRYVEGQVLTCRDIYGHAFPQDSVRQRDLMLAIGCANGRDTMQLARVGRAEGGSAAADSLVAHLEGTARSDTAHTARTKKP